MNPGSFTSMLLDYDPDDLDVRVAELLVATHDESDPLLHPSVQEVLKLLRERLRMDVVFVSQFEDERRTFRAVDAAPGADVIKAGQSDPLEQSWCQRVVEGRLPELVRDARPHIASGVVPAAPFDIGTHLSTPVVLQNGVVFGTLCCFSFDVQDEINQGDLRRLKYTARLIAENIGEPGPDELTELQPLV